MAVFNRFQQSSLYLQIQAQDLNCSIPLNQIKKIFSLMALTAVPKTPSYLAGVFNYHGNLVPVIDLSLRLGQKVSSSYSSSTPVVLCSTLENDSLLGLIVSAVGNVTELNHSRFYLASHFSGKSLPFSSVYQEHQQVCLLLNTDVLLSSSLAVLYSVPPDEVDKMIRQNIFNFSDDPQ